MHPLTDVSKIIERQDGICLVVNNTNIDFVEMASRLLRQVHHIPKYLMRLNQAIMTWKDWLRLEQSLEAGLAFVDIVELFCGNQS